MKATKPFILLLLCSAVFVFTGCTKNNGCTDSEAVNYDADAEKDDGSCQFQGNLLIWINKNTSDSLISYSIDDLHIYLDNVNVGTYATDMYFVESPYCTDSTAFVVQETWEESRDKSFAYKATDVLNNTLWQGNLTLQANACNSVQLIWQ